jgi:hypothetical protein
MPILIRVLLQLAAMGISVLLWRWASGRGSVELPSRIGLKAKLAVRALGAVAMGGVATGLFIATVALLLLHGPLVVVAVFGLFMALAVYVGVRLTLPIYRSLKNQQRLHVLDDLDEVQDR